MEIKFTIPDDEIAAQIAAQAIKIDTANRLVPMKEACMLTYQRRARLNAAVKARMLTHYIIDGKPHFRVSDLWKFIDQFKVEAKD